LLLVLLVVSDVTFPNRTKGPLPLHVKKGLFFVKEQQIESKCMMDCFIWVLLKMVY